MTDTVSLLLSSVCNWLQDPRIRIESVNAPEVAALQIQVQQLQEDLDKAKREAELNFARYTNELNFNFRLQDLLKEHHISWR